MKKKVALVTILLANISVSYGQEPEKAISSSDKKEIKALFQDALVKEILHWQSQDYLCFPTSISTLMAGALNCSVKFGKNFAEFKLNKSSTISMISLPFLIKRFDSKTQGVIQIEPSFGALYKYVKGQVILQYYEKLFLHGVDPSIPVFDGKCLKEVLMEEMNEFMQAGSCLNLQCKLLEFYSNMLGLILNYEKNSKIEIDQRIKLS